MMANSPSSLTAAQGMLSAFSGADNFGNVAPAATETASNDAAAQGILSAFSGADNLGNVAPVTAENVSNDVAAQGMFSAFSGADNSGDVAPATVGTNNNSNNEDNEMFVRQDGENPVATNSFTSLLEEDHIMTLEDVNHPMSSDGMQPSFPLSLSPAGSNPSNADDEMLPASLDNNIHPCIRLRQLNQEMAALIGNLENQHNA